MSVVSTKQQQDIYTHALLWLTERAGHVDRMIEDEHDTVRLERLLRAEMVSELCADMIMMIDLALTSDEFQARILRVRAAQEREHIARGGVEVSHAIDGGPGGLGSVAG